MEQYTKELGIDMADPQSASCVVFQRVGLNGQIKIINTDLSEKNGGSYVQSVISNMIKRNLVKTQHGIKGKKVYKNGTTSLVYCKPLGIKALKARKKLLADIAGKSFTHPKLHQDSVQRVVRLIKEKKLIYLLENKLITL